MNYLYELLCAVLPGILLILFIRWKDSERPEPAGMLIKGFAYGCLSVLLTCVIHMFTDLFYVELDGIPVVHAIYVSFYCAALPEETAKLIMLWLLLRNNKEFDERLDGIVYAVCVGMGFATVENIQYVFDSEWWGMTAYVRAILAVPGHYIDAVLMGFFYAIYRFAPVKYKKYRFLILFAPFLSHGIYDTLCFIGEEDWPELGALMDVLLLYFCYRLHRFCLARIDSLSRLDNDVEQAKLFESGMKNGNR